MDVLANVLSVTNLATHVLGSREFVAPWGVLMDNMDKSMVHLIRRGSCWMRCGNTEPVRLNTGDVVLFSNGDAHTLSSERDMQDLEPYSEAIARARGQLIPPRDGSDNPAAEVTILQCAGYAFSQEGPHPLLTLLPPVIVIPADQAGGDSELQLLLRLLFQEGVRRDAGSELVLPRLIDTLFVYVLRSWLREQPEGSCGWLGALRDTQIRKALSLIHERPQDQWTVELLAHAVAMSRAAFAKRFTDLVGEPPLAYVTRWRMDLAAKLLRESRDPVARIAGKVGYISETAFAKAFRRRRKMAPGAYRYQRNQANRANQANGSL